MAVQTTNNKPINPRGNDQSPKGYNRASLFSGKALDFDGVNDEVNCGNIDIAFNEISFAFHFNADSFSNNCIFQKESVFRFIGVNTNQIDIVLATTGNSWYSKKMTLTNLESKDYFLVATYNGSELKAYLNGVLVDTLGGYSGSVASVSQNVYVGRTNGGLYYNGKISGARIFNTALTAAQVSDLYNNPEKIVPTGVSNDALKLWLPMMEGAGTTAYDGSGNGNHGTISGATYVNGVGSPVAQTAVIDWNKGVNLTPNSEDLSQWTKNNVVVTTNATTAPDGKSTADEVENDANNTSHRIYQISGSNTSTNDVAFSVYLKYKDHQYVSFGPTDDTFYRAQFVVDLVGGTITETYTNNANVVSSSLTDVGNGWYKLEGVITPTTAWVNNIYALTMLLSGSTWSSGGFTSAGTSVYVWGAQVEYASANGPYVPTFGTAQTSPVLLPQGLTSGRDITGVNLFENVRKQGALNLDGNSWAEVHDNASLDITDAITLEAWVWYLEGDSDWAAISKYQNSSEAFMMFFYPARSVKFFANGGQKATTGNVLINNAWNHVVITYDKTNVKIYIDGNEEASTAYTTALTTTSKVVEIGRYWGSNAYGTDGSKIAQPRIYNRALTAEEVQRNYDAGKNIYTNS